MLALQYILFLIDYKIHRLVKQFKILTLNFDRLQHFLVHINSTDHHDQVPWNSKVIQWKSNTVSSSGIWFGHGVVKRDAAEGCHKCNRFRLLRKQQSFLVCQLIMTTIYSSVELLHGIDKQLKDKTNLDTISTGTESWRFWKTWLFVDLNKRTFNMFIFIKNTGWFKSVDLTTSSMME